MKKIKGLDYDRIWEEPERKDWFSLEKAAEVEHYLSYSVIVGGYSLSLISPRYGCEHYKF